MNTSFFRDLLEQIVDQGRTLSPILSNVQVEKDIYQCLLALLSSRGESSGVAIARSIIRQFDELEAQDELNFFTYINETFAPDEMEMKKAAELFLQSPSRRTTKRLCLATESPRQELFRRINLAPLGTAAIVAMRAKLLKLLNQNPELQSLDDDILHLLRSWFNRGFLVMRRIDWSFRANILEKIIAYEAVHAIEGWDDLKRRLDPIDRRCYAFFHPSLIDEPLIFVEVALTNQMPDQIQVLLDDHNKKQSSKFDTAVFYSISNCQHGLSGISFGNFLIKQVAEDLSAENTNIKNFCTLSPIPGWGKWLQRELKSKQPIELVESHRADLVELMGQDMSTGIPPSQQLEMLLTRLAAYYLVKVKHSDGTPLDPVARFHIGNGAKLVRINWRGDLSERGLSQSAGMMVNYLYELKSIEHNHEAYAENYEMAIAPQIEKLLSS